MNNATRERAGYRGTEMALWVLAILATLFFLREASQLLIPIVLAVLVSYALEPIVGWLSRHRVPRMVGASAVMAIVVAVAAYGVITLRDDALALVDALPQLVQRAREWVVSGGVAGGTFTDAAEALASGPAAAGNGMMNLLQRGAGAVFAVAGHVVVIVFLVFFLLLSGPHFRGRLLEIAAGDGERHRTVARIMDDINTQVQRFLLVRLVTSTVVGVLTWAALAWLGVQNAAVWGALAGVFNSIPYFGPVIVSGGLLLVGLLQGGGLSQALQMSAAALVITALEGWLITPPLMGKAERMSVLAVFLGLLLWTWLWGAWGTLLAVPMLAVMQSVATHVPALKPFGRLLAP